MPNKHHWEHVYSNKKSNAVSWFQTHADQSLRLIRSTGVPRSASIIDVGGGSSTLVDDLLHEAYSDVSVLDLSAAALSVSQARLGLLANHVKWIEGDITKIKLPIHAYDIWHDRAVFHFLTKMEDRQAYVDTVLHAVKPGGHVIVSTFAEDGPLQCSGLAVMRYSPTELHAEFGAPFTLIQHEREEHVTPNGTVQKFVYCYCRKIQS